MSSTKHSAHLSNIVSRRSSSIATVNQFRQQLTQILMAQLMCAQCAANFFAVEKLFCGLFADTCAMWNVGQIL